MARVQLRDVHKSYGGNAVIHGVDVDVADGEFIVMVGPSGCGKSTLLRMVAGLEEITGGEIAIGDRVVNTLEPKERDIAMVFQNYALYPHMTVFDNMAYGCASAGSQRTTSRRASTARRDPRARSALPRKPRQLSEGSASGWRWARDRPRAGRVPVRRALVQPRREAPRPDALRDTEAPSGA
jgi:sn-glycerol 3-phosphate transport system ATP-binding protein